MHSFRSKFILVWNGIWNKILVWNGRFLVWNGRILPVWNMEKSWKNRPPYHALLIDTENAFFQAKQILQHTNSSQNIGLQLLDMDI